MKSMVKKIFLTASIIVCCGVVLIGGAWCSTCSDDSPCTNVCIMVKDSLERQFVGTTEIEGYLKQKGCYPLAQTMESIDCHTIEQCLLKHDMVRNAECYKSPFGAVHIKDICVKVAVAVKVCVKIVMICKELAVVGNTRNAHGAHKLVINAKLL